MKERPILFSAPMVRAILSGTKTQTRRVVKDGPALHQGHTAWEMTRCPYGQPGGVLWVRETWRHIEGGAVYDAAGGVMDAFDSETIYRADKPHAHGPWKPAIHMPRWASRITLEVTGVRVERLQDISEDDCLAEGIANVVRENLPRIQQCGEYDAIDVDPVAEYQSLWESINGPGSWDTNPWVWVIEFKRTEAA